MNKGPFDARSRARYVQPMEPGAPLVDRYSCAKWWCLRLSPPWRAFYCGGKHWCDRHVPEEA